MRQFLAALLALPLLSTPLAAQPARAPVVVSPADKDCMARVMIFEARQRDHNSLLAVGTVVANRAESGRWAPNWCAVVTQRMQFTSNPMSSPLPSLEIYDFAMSVAEAIASGLRHPALTNVYHFRTTGSARSAFMSDVADVGGNTYYVDLSTAHRSPRHQRTTMATSTHGLDTVDQTQLDAMIAAANAAFDRR